MMEFASHQLQKIKLGVHIAQAVLIVISWILEIMVFTSSAKIDGRPGWFFGLVCTALPRSYETRSKRDGMLTVCSGSAS